MGDSALSNSSVVLSFADHLLAGGSEQDGVFVLSSVASLHITERRVGVHNAGIAQVLQSHQVLGLTQPAQRSRKYYGRRNILAYC